jgi:hypothetical protein
MTDEELIVRDVVEHHLGDLEAYAQSVRGRLRAGPG